MPCVKIWPAKACGLHGNCVPGPNGTTFCQCDQGWEQTREFNYFVDDLNSGLCNINVAALKFLYYGLLLAGVTYLCFLLRGLAQPEFGRRMRKIKKRTPNILAALFAIIIGSHRIAASAATFGNNAFFTFTFISALFLNIYLIEGYLNRYLEYIVQKPKWLEELQTSSFSRIKSWLKRTYKLHDIVLIMTSITFISWWATSIFAQPQIALFFSRLAVSIVIVFVLIKDELIVMVTITVVINDLKCLADLIGDADSRHQDRINRYVAARTAHLKTMRAIIGCFQLLEILYAASLVFIDYMYAATLSYFIPLYFLVVLMMNSLVIYLAALNKKGAPTTPKTTASPGSQEHDPPTVQEVHSDVDAYKDDYDYNEQDVKQAYEDVNGKVSTGPPIDSNGLAVQTTGIESFNSFDPAIKELIPDLNE